MIEEIDIGSELPQRLPVPRGQQAIKISKGTA
jgi:hypothetical protein